MHLNGWAVPYDIFGRKHEMFSLETVRTCKCKHGKEMRDIINNVIKVQGRLHIIIIIT